MPIAESDKAQLRELTREVIRTDFPAIATRAELRELMREVIRDDAPAVARAVAWKIAEEAVARGCKAVRLEMQLSLWKLIAMLLASGAVGGGVVKLVMGH